MCAAAARGQRRLHPTRSVESASAYLVAKLGGDEAEAVLRHATMCASVLTRGTKVLAKDARRATRLAEQLLEYLHDDDAATRVLQRLIERWRQPAKRGAPVCDETLFVRMMQLWADREGKRALRPDELMAAAVAIRLIPRKKDWRPVLDSWRKRRRATSPMNDLLWKFASAPDHGSSFWRRILGQTKDFASEVSATSARAVEEVLVARDLQHVLGESRPRGNDGVLTAD